MGTWPGRSDWCNRPHCAVGFFCLLTVVEAAMSAPRGPGVRRPLPARPVWPGRPCAILGAEGGQATGALWRAALTGAGHRVAVAHGPAEAVGALATVRFDLVLAAAPPGARWGTLERLRTLAGGAPVVVIAAHRPARRADWRARGFAALLATPVDLDELRATVDEQLAPGRAGGARHPGTGARATPEGR